MKSVKFLKCICAFCVVGSALFFSRQVMAGNTHWSINIGMPFVVGLPSAVTYSSPVIPVATMISPVPAHPYVGPPPAPVHRPMPHWNGAHHRKGDHPHDRGHR